MYEFARVVDERDRIMVDLLEGRKANYNELRQACKNFNERCTVEKQFNTEGSDEQLWESVIEFFYKLLKKSA